jgi:copper chaperone CopZ
MQRIKQRLESRPGIRSVNVNPTTGSVIVTGDHDDQIHEALDTALELVESLHEGKPSEKAVETVVGAVKAADFRMRQSTGGRISLKWLVPGAFVGIGLRQLLAEGLTIGAVPWYVLVYYGVDSFLKLNPEHAPKAESELHRMQEAPSPHPG